MDDEAPAAYQSSALLSTWVDSIHTSLLTDELQGSTADTTIRQASQPWSLKQQPTPPPNRLFIRFSCKDDRRLLTN